MEYSEAITITFGDQAENNVGMQKIGNVAQSGYTLEQMSMMADLLRPLGAICTIYHLSDNISPTFNAEPAYLLIIERGVNYMLPSYNGDLSTAAKLYNEQWVLPRDTKALMYGKVVNKHARYNLCFADFSQEPDYNNGKGRVVDFKFLPLLQKLRINIELLLGEKAGSLVAEGNYYYDTNTCGIGFHGDSERHKVVGVRLGNSAAIPLHFQWFYQGSPVGKRAVFTLNHGDIYVMSEKTVGTDWKSKNKFTLRHAAGAHKYTTIKE